MSGLYPSGPGSGAASAARTAETQWPAPAKLNLFLHVVGRRPDGYHDLQTAFQLIDLCDTVALTVRTDGRIERLEGPADVPPESDLTVRAAQALRAAAEKREATQAGEVVPNSRGFQREAAARGAAASPVPARLGVSIRVLKRIPMGGGLGGGSSDAATTLLALNALWRCGFSIDMLAELGLQLGADVPVFVRGRSAWGEGRGERLTPLQLPQRWYVVIHPRVPVATAEIFQAPELTRNSPLITIRAFFESGGRNDCEPVVRKCAPEVADALDWLARFAPAHLTGTGSCIFADCASAAEAERIAARAPDRWTSFVARGLDVSPMHERLAALRI